MVFHVYFSHRNKLRQVKKMESLHGQDAEQAIIIAVIGAMSTVAIFAGMFYAYAGVIFK